MQDVGDELILGICSVVFLHGGSLAASAVGDEVRRRHPDLWRRWKARSDAKKCAAGLLRVCVERGGHHGLVVVGGVEGASAPHGEPMLRYNGGPVNVWSDPGNDGVAARLAEEEAAASATLRRALLVKARKYPNGRDIPVLWLAIACERELARHIRLMPKFEDESERGNQEAVDDEGGLSVDCVMQGAHATRDRECDRSLLEPTTFSVGAETRKVRLARRIKTIVAGQSETQPLIFLSNRCAAAHHRAGCCCRGIVRLTEAGVVEAEAQSDLVLTAAGPNAVSRFSTMLPLQRSVSCMDVSIMGRAARQGEGRRAWRRHEQASLPSGAAAVTNEIVAAVNTTVSLDVTVTNEGVTCWILLVRSQGSSSKEASLMVLELEAIAEHHGVPRGALKELAPGVWVLAAGKSGPPGDAALFPMVGALPHLVGLRAILHLHSAGAHSDGASLADAVPKVLCGSMCASRVCQAAALPPPSWSIEMEMRERPSDPARLPFRACPGTELALNVAATMAACAPEYKYSTFPGLHATTGHRALVVVEAGGGALLLCERVALQPASLKSCPFGCGDEALAESWHRSWAARPFFFSACLDSHVAAAVVSLGFLALQQRAVQMPPRLLDVCCGSGTLAAVAAASGLFARVAAVDTDAGFLARVPANLTHIGVGHGQVQLLVHDATHPFPESIRMVPPDLVASNPPWGWRLKVQSQDSVGTRKPSSGKFASDIVLNLLREFPHAVFVFVCPELPTGADLQASGFEVHQRCALGQSAVWVLVPSCCPERVEDIVTANG